MFNALHHLVKRDGNILVSLERLIKLPKVKVNIQDYRGQTPLMLAARDGHLECVKFLIKHGAKLEIKNKDGKTALDYTTGKFKQPHVRFYLLNYDLKISSENEMTEIFDNSSLVFSSFKNQDHKQPIIRTSETLRKKTKNTF